MSEILPLKDFIVTTLTSICDAVEEVRGNKSYVAFKHSSHPDPNKQTLIEFDLAVTITESSSTGANIEGSVKSGISVIAATIKGMMKEDETNSRMELNRIRFNIPVDFSLDETKYNEARNKLKKPLPLSGW